MAEYIDKHEAYLLLKDLEAAYIYPPVKEAYATAARRIDEIKATDVQPVKHGEWDFQGYQLFKCTNCKEIFTQNQFEAMQNHINQEEFTFPNFCPNCGARMDGDKE